MKSVTLIFLFAFFAISEHSLAGKILAQAQVAQEGTMLYQSADFKSAVLGYLSSGETIGILAKRQGEFFRVETSTGEGYVARTDIKIIKKSKTGSTAVETQPKRNKKAAVKKNDDLSLDEEDGSIFTDLTEDNDEEDPGQTLELKRFVGIEARQIEFRESTAGDFHKEDLSGFGLKFTGGNLLVEGDLPMEVNLFWVNKTPDYYQKITGQEPSSGNLILADALFITPFAGDERTQFFSGFGPMLRYSNFNVKAGPASSQQAYNMTNVNVGVSFAVGFGMDFERFQLRGDYRYYFEKKQHNGFAMALLLPL